VGAPPTRVNALRAPRVVGLDEIRRAINLPALLTDIERAFVEYSSGRAVVAPVGHLAFRDPPGDLHLKYGYIDGGDMAVVKLATGVPSNAALGLPTGDGLMIVVDRRTGLVRAILLDRAYLTDLRTAAAGAIAAKHLAPSRLRTIGMLGAGVQARMQLELLSSVSDCRVVMLWNRTRMRAEEYAREMRAMGYEVTIAPHADTVAKSCELIVTTTAARGPLFDADCVRPSTHITAVGADAPGKQELDPRLFARADIVVADSVSQCADHGDLAHALSTRDITLDRVYELGRVISGDAPKRVGADQITIADLTGVAVQDIAIAAHVCTRI